MQPFIECILLVLLGGFVCHWVQSAPMVEPRFRAYAAWLVALATGIGVLARLGVLAHLRRIVG